MTRLREIIGRLLYWLYLWGFWRSPDYWLTSDWQERYGYGQFLFTNRGEFQFPVRSLERDTSQ